MMSKCQIGQNTDFPARIRAINIRRGICLGIAVFLRFLQGCFQRHAVLLHPREDVIRRAVQNAGDFVDIVCGKALRQRSDNRDTAANRRFKQIIHVLFPRQFDQFRAPFGNQFLIRRHNAFSGQKRALCIVIRHTQTAYRFHNNPDFRIVFDNGKIMDYFIRKRAFRKITDIQNIFQFDRVGGVRIDGLRILA